MAANLSRSQRYIARCRKAGLATFFLNAVWKLELDYKVCGQIFKSCVESILFYGCESWVLTTARRQKIVSTWSNLLRRALNKPWDLSLELLLAVSGLTHPLQVLNERRFKFLGHYLRIGQREIASHDSNKMRPLTTVMRWRGTAPTKYTAGGIKMLRRKQRLGKGNMTTQLREMRSLLDGGDGARVTRSGEQVRSAQPSRTSRAAPPVDHEAESYSALVELSAERGKWSRIARNCESFSRV